MLKRISALFLALTLLICTISTINVTAQETKEEETSFKLVLMPDTQVYSSHYPEIFLSQTQWLADNFEKENIKFVLHLGDVVDGNTPQQWENADAAMDVLDENNVPYGITIGNHDIGNNNQEFIENYGKERMQDNPGYIAHSDNELNSAYTFSACGYDFLVLFLNLDASQEDLDWAQSIIDENPGKPTILATHTLIGPDGTLATKPYVRSGGKSPAYIFDNFIAKNDQIFMTANGHDHGAFNIVRSNINGLEVNQYLVDYQGSTKGGNGYLRIMEFNFKENTISHTSYSPYTDDYLTDGENTFVEELEFERRFNNETKEYAPGEIITPIVAAYSTQEERWGGRFATQLTDGSGIIGYNGQTKVDENAVHASGSYESAAEGMWNSLYLGVKENGLYEGDKSQVKEIADRQESITFDLGRNVDLSQTLIWQYGEATADEDRTTQGAKEIQVLVSSDAKVSDAVFHDAGTITLDKHTTGTQLKAQIKDLDQENVRFVKFVFKSNYGDMRTVGLSEVRFVASGAKLSNTPADKTEQETDTKPTTYEETNEFTIAKTDSATQTGWAHYIGQSITPFMQGMEGTGSIPEGTKYALLKEFTVFIFDTTRVPKELYAYNIEDVPADTDTLYNSNYSFTTASGETFNYPIEKIATATYSEELSEEYDVSASKKGIKATYVFETPVLVGIDEEIMLIFDQSTGLRYWQSTEYDGGYAIWTNGASETANYRVLPFKTDIDFIAKLSAVTDTSTADYSKVDEAIELANKLDASLYENFELVTDALSAVVRDLSKEDQEKVDQMAQNILNAIAQLSYKDADYSHINDLIATIPEDLDAYTKDSVNTLQNVLDSIDWDKNITQQHEVDQYAKLLENAINGLVKNNDSNDATQSPNTGDQNHWLLLSGILLTLACAGLFVSKRTTNK